MEYQNLAASSGSWCHPTASAVVGGADQPVGQTRSDCYRHPYKSVRISIVDRSGSVTRSAALPKERRYLPSCVAVAVTPFAHGVGWFLRR